MTPPGGLGHLARRFFGSLRARRPSPEDQLMVAGALPRHLARLFWAQPIADQAHGITAARRVAMAAPARDELVAAALLHDIGKRHSRLGVFGRSLASMLSLLRLPVRGRSAAYLDHGELGATELEAAGATRLVSAFARHHHGTCPDGVDPTDWELLVAADDE